MNKGEPYAKSANATGVRSSGMLRYFEPVRYRVRSLLNSHQPSPGWEEESYLPPS
jgi:hypothetical protein